MTASGPVPHPVFPEPMGVTGAAVSGTPSQAVGPVRARSLQTAPAGSVRPGTFHLLKLQIQFYEKAWVVFSLPLNKQQPVATAVSWSCPVHLHHQDVAPSAWKLG